MRLLHVLIHSALLLMYFSPIHFYPQISIFVHTFFTSFTYSFHRTQLLQLILFFHLVNVHLKTTFFLTTFWTTLALHQVNQLGLTSRFLVYSFLYFPYLFPFLMHIFLRQLFNALSVTHARSIQRRSYKLFNNKGYHNLNLNRYLL